MGGAADLPQRSSSPLKRRAEELEAEADAQSGQKDDVDMIVVPELEAESTDASTRPTHSGRTQSIDMLLEEQDPTASDPTAQAEATVAAVPTKSGPLHLCESSQNLQALTTNPPEIPPIDTQIKTVTTLCEAAAQGQLNEGDKVYLVSQRWLNRVISRGSEAMQKSKSEPEGEIGAVDNSDIIQQIFIDFNNKDFVQLKQGVGQESYMMFPEDAWTMVVDWYGLMAGHIPIIRIAHNTNPDKFGLPNMQYEIHPPIFVIHRLWSDAASLLSPPIKVRDPDAPVFVFSRSEKYVDFLKHIKRAAQVEPTRKIRVWRVPRVQPAAESTAPVINTVTPPSSRPGSESGSPGAATSQEQQDSWPKLLLDVATFAKIPRGEGRELVETEDHSINTNYNGKSDIGFIGLGDSQAIVIDEFVEGKDYVTTYSPKASKTSTVSTRSTALAPQTNSQTNSGRNSPAPSGPMTRGRTQRNGRTPGTVGLSNLGNTCYMNSALQCVRSVEELTKYFLSGAARDELNSDNPLGNNGDVATAYENLLTDIYNTKQGSVAPRVFKNTIGRYAPSFSGYGQQDSQEFLGFLLDGLQEDLSRVKKKPYIEKPDSTDDMVDNPEAIREMAAKVWDITKKRDDSVIADLFTGMYKSTLVCPVCEKVSITFDPFNNLTLQLPIENSWSHSIYFFPLNDKPIIILVDIDKQATILAMKHFLSKRVGVPVERLFVAEEFKYKFYKIYDNYDIASDEISANDIVTVYELEAKPTNWPDPNKSAKKQKTYGSSPPKEPLPGWDSPLADNLLVPVFYRIPNKDRPRYGTRKPWEIKAVPHFIMVTPEEARSEEMIKKKVLQKLVTFTTYPDLLDDDEEANDSVAESVDPDIVLTNGSDSSGDKIVANSIDGEDELVDVTMKDSNGDRESVETNSLKYPETKASKSVLNSNKRPPKFMEPGAFVDPRFQNMFELCYFSTNEYVPAGLQAVDEDKNYPSISSRIPRFHDADEPEDDNMANGRAGSESSNEDNGYDRPGFSNTRMNDVSSDEDESSPAPVSRPLPVRSAAPKFGFRVGPNRRRATRIKTYSRKGNQPVRNLLETRDSDEDIPDDGPLIRLGEGIVVNWTADAYANLFEGAANDTMRGQGTWGSVIQTWEDPELDAKRKSRTERRKNGISLDECLDEFGKEEILSEQDTWYCPRCKEHRRATKKFELWKTSDILVMHLKRFSSSGFRRDKLEVRVDFPIVGLDLSSRVIEKEDGKSEIYDLFAVDDHWGGLGGGHYTAFTKNYNDDKWYEYNDSSVSEVKDVNRVVSPAAYLLFYRRRSDTPLGGSKVQESISRFDKPETSEDDEADSGEGQRLGANSSLRGSSSALTGVGAALHPANGSGAAAGQTMTVNPQDLDQPPAYQAHETEDDAAPLLQRDAAMNEGLGLQDSIEDEGIDMGVGFTPINQGSNQGVNIRSAWNFDALDQLNNSARQHNFRISGTGSEIDLNENSDNFDVDGSDIVQHNSSASEGSMRGRLEDFDNAIPMGDDGDPFEDPSPVPDVEDDNQIDTLHLHRDLLQSHNRPPPEFQVHAPEQEEEIEEPATEIHIEDTDELKMD